MRNKTDELQEEFIKSFINLRKSKKLTQKTLSEKSGVMRETVARIETGISSPQIDTLIKILKPIGYTIKIGKIQKKSK